MSWGVAACLKNDPTRDPDWAQNLHCNDFDILKIYILDEHEIKLDTGTIIHQNERNSSLCNLL